MTIYLPLQTASLPESCCEVEVCAGEGNLSRGMRDAGFRGKAFDVTCKHLHV